MSVLAVGLSHNSAPVTLLERAALDVDASAKLLKELVSSDCVTEAVVLATCNRVEVYAEVSRFHAGVTQVSESLGTACDASMAELTDHLYVHYEDRAVEHLFTVAAGLDSMVLGEQQILSQLRAALALARGESAVGRSLGPLIERALRAGRRAQADTGIAAAGRSLVGVGIDVVSGDLGGLTDRPVAVVGAGSVSSLATRLLQRAGAGSITVLNRTFAKGQRLAATVGGRALPMSDLRQALAEADLVVSCTGAAGVVVTGADVAAALAARNGRHLALLDLALPHDVAEGVRRLPGVHVVGLDELRKSLAREQVGEAVEAARRVVADEVGGWLARRRADRVAPTVVALRARAGQVVDAELTRLLRRLPDLDERAIAEVRQTMSRTVDKLLHAPTIRIKELAEAPDGDSYAQALRDLFALDPQTTEALARAGVVVEDEITGESPAGGHE